MLAASDNELDSLRELPADLPTLHAASFAMNRLGPVLLGAPPPPPARSSSADPLSDVPPPHPANKGDTRAASVLPTAVRWPRVTSLDLSVNAIERLAAPGAPPLGQVRARSAPVIFKNAQKEREGGRKDAGAG